MRGRNVREAFFLPYAPPLCVFITQECFVRYVDITVEESKKLYVAPDEGVSDRRGSCPASWSLPKVLKALPKLFGEFFPLRRLFRVFRSEKWRSVYF